MGKRLGALSAVIAVVALAVGIALPAAGSTGNAAQDQTIRVTAVDTELKLLDLGGPGFSRPRGDLAMTSGTVTFITDGLATALRRARAAAGGRDVAALEAGWTSAALAAFVGVSNACTPS